MMDNHERQFLKPLNCAAIIRPQAILTQVVTAQFIDEFNAIDLTDCFLFEQYRP